MDGEMRGDDSAAGGQAPAAPEGRRRAPWYAVNGNRLVGLLLFGLGGIFLLTGRTVEAAGLAIAASLCLVAAAIDESRGPR